MLKPQLCTSAGSALAHKDNVTMTKHKEHVVSIHLTFVAINVKYL